ncbi:geranylgeranyl hydrogenase [Dissulfurispira thermophila]|uniref:Geranylgeranyl hydrogenase n=1 Tax=Dissulfurispira thermophila TaxID=2715679 RepID=A0A7G1GYH6_9BACT|nr:NAD(P)/FAD-dependent oxidoreductase [Dissulfurispira thermophila]BCB95505.1 geranylgeranyl hydrogenase [Dissulfurispira thermophila]
MIRTQVLIIGGGPAGSTAARFLSDSGIDTVLLERDMSYVKPCGGGIPSTAFHELNIPEEIVKKKIKKIHIISPKGEEIKVELKGGYLCITGRGTFDAKLRELAKKSGAILIEAEFLRFEEFRGKIISIARKKSSKDEIKIKSDYVIASDGITFRTGLSMKCNKPDCLSTISAHITSDNLDACEFWFGSSHASQFYSWVFPSDGYSSIGTGCVSSKDLSHLLNSFIKRRFGIPLKDFADQNFINKPRAFKIPSWNGTIFNINNILFAGDAAGTVMPVTYEGIYYAMKSGEFAAQAITEGKPSVYKKLWNSKFRNRFLLMSKIRNYLFGDDAHIEKFIALHKKPEVQEIAMRLWLKKETGSSAFISYLKFFKHFLKV